MKSRTSEYNSLHQWIIRHYGKAKSCEICKSETEKRYEWALIHGKEYKKNIDNFMQLCNSCHQKYDTTDEKRRQVSERLKGVKISPEHLKKIIEYATTRRKPFYATSPDGIEYYFEGLHEMCKQYKINIGNLTSGINGKRKTVNGWSNFKKVC